MIRALLSEWVSIRQVKLTPLVLRMRTTSQSCGEQGLIEPVIYNAGYWKLRQITIGYDFSKFLPQDVPDKGCKVEFYCEQRPNDKKMGAEYRSGKFQLHFRQRSRLGIA